MSLATFGGPSKSGPIYKVAPTVIFSAGRSPFLAVGTQSLLELPVLTQTAYQVGVVIGFVDFDAVGCFECFCGDWPVVAADLIGLDELEILIDGLPIATVVDDLERFDELPLVQFVFLSTISNPLRKTFSST